MLKIINTLLDSIFPPRPGELVVRSTTKVDMSSLYTNGIYQDCIFLSAYQTPTIQALIKENKFHRNRYAAQLLAGLLEQWIMNQKTNSFIIIPIPLGTKRAKERGYNQVTEVARTISMPNVRVDTTILKRVRETKAQTELARVERLKNMTGAFACDPTAVAALTSTTIILVDDVLTTGATLAAARATLAPHLHPTTTLYCVALAH